jgi:very-short-patch-repair endonuclease
MRLRPVKAVKLGPEFTLEVQLDHARILYQREYRFSPLRKYRFDFAFLPAKLAVEIEGGIWTYGAHSRPLGIIRDITKGNLAILSGWRVLRYTPSMVNDGTALHEIREALQAPLGGEGVAQEKPREGEGVQSALARAQQRKASSLGKAEKTKT